ncbi:MAG: DUF433 domain-containing protein [Chloroflexi bacterium AL-W]|nr:DUF433 domain-containing protein [Chloroflexi bacterium AL-N1]NOK71339.1 DUF433 domain-containing protein [Chloroflexi bacterium AL-N10]NOK78742.1 DUF433 domain-containing protein [Chloroflexi bacterium AL-N5]NOK86112.1 DUF433 domain-containing protein [Chloroflexi bacterium AL-W]NOK93065.1 DUF433 domain-containing protein [Chloroflexi bacterium AL-N15]
MATTATTYAHVVLDEHGVPHIEGTTMKVIELVLDTLTYGWSPKEAQYQHPYLSLGQVYSALAYYWDHKDVLDADIAQRLAYVDDVQRQIPPSLLHTRLRK